MMSENADATDIMIATNVSAFRRKRKVQSKDLADYVGISANTMCRYENAQTRIPPSVLLRIADALSVPVAAFFRRDGEELDSALSVNGSEALVLAFSRCPPEVRNALLRTAQLWAGKTVISAGR